MLTRRGFLLQLPAFAATAYGLPALLDKHRGTRIFIGCDTDKGVAKGIYSASFDPATGQLGNLTLAAETPRPSFLAVAPAHDGHRSLFAVNAVKSPTASVTTFDLELSTGALRQRSRVSSSGAGPCYVSVDRTGKAAFVANYWGATIASYTIQSDGTLSNPVDSFDYREPRFGHQGPNTVRQEQPHPHSVHLSPDNRYLIVNDLGNDALTVYSVDPANGHLAPSSPLLIPMRAGSGPRHIAFHPNKRWVYCINELDSTLDRLEWNEMHGSSSSPARATLVNANATVSTLAKDFKGTSTASEVMISPDGHFLYASNRGEDTLVVFAIGKEGALSEVQRITCGGKTPRHFAFDPSFRWILCGNQDSASVTSFRRNHATGRLSGPVSTLEIDSPFYILFA